MIFKKKNFLKKKILEKKYSGKIITENSVINLKKEIQKINFFNTPRNLCLIECSNSVDSILLYLSIIFYDNIPLLVNEDLNYEFLKNYINKYQPEFIITKKKINIENYKLISNLNNTNIYKVINHNNKKINDNLALLLPTSGTTGSQKLVKISYENLYENTKDICNFLKIKKNHTTITTMPFSYTYGMSIINTHVYKSSKIFVYNGSVIDKNFQNLLNKLKINSFGGVPFTYEILRKIRFNKFKFKHLKYLTHAGGAMSLNTLSFFYEYCKKQKINFISMYGAAEATSRMSYLPFKFMKSKIGSIGKGLQNSFKIFKNNKFINKPYIEGEIVFNGKNVFMGYSNDYRDLIFGNLNNYRLKTGDMGYFDKDGFFFITGRKNRYAKIYGLRINLDELEKNLNEKFSLCYLKFVNERIIVFTPNNYNLNNITNFIFERYKLNKNIFTIKKINKVPLKANNKIDYNKLI
jgi:long-chain acyl-CoA synthetase